MPSEIATLWLNAFPITGWLGIDHFASGCIGTGVGKLLSNVFFIAPVWNFVDFLTLVLQDRFLGCGPNARFEWTAVDPGRLAKHKIMVTVFHMLMILVLVSLVLWLTFKIRQHRKSKKCLSC